MQKKQFFPISLLCSAVLLSSPINVLAQTKVAKAIATRGKVTANNGSTERKLRRGAAINQKDTISTALKSSLKMIFTGGTLITVKPESIMEIETYLLNKKQPEKNQMKVNLSKGGFKSLSGLITKNSPDAYKVNCSDVAVIGVRGTLFELTARPVLSGKDAVACKNKAVKLAYNAHGSASSSIGLLAQNNSDPGGQICFGRVLTGQCNIEYGSVDGPSDQQTKPTKRQSATPSQTVAPSTTLTSKKQQAASASSSSSSTFTKPSLPSIKARKDFLARAGQRRSQLIRAGDKKNAFKIVLKKGRYTFKRITSSQLRKLTQDSCSS